MGAGAGALHPQKQARVQSALVSGGLRASRSRAALSPSRVGQVALVLGLRFARMLLALS